MGISSNATGLRPGVCTSTTRPTSPYNGQLIYETDTTKVYIYNGTSWVEQPTAGMVDAKGDLLVGTADNTITKLSVGTNTYILVADSAATNGVKWAVNSRPLCIVENTSFTLSDSVNTDIAYTSEVTDSLDWHSNTTNTTRITPTIAGVYRVTLMLNNISGTTRALHGVYKNGGATDVPVFMDTPGTIDDFSVTGYVTANGSTDYFTHRALVTGKNCTGCKAQFAMEWVGPT